MPFAHPIGHLPCPTDASGRPDRAADAVRPLPGVRVARRAPSHPWQGRTAADAPFRLRQAGEDGRAAGSDAGVPENRRTVPEPVAAGNSPLGAVD
ncbi:hypothetical protein [Streptomyces rishiriensis]|uniref:Uncharacterized protein n=1 Tax=Streptomyces rishiriensis TaxID=68264 RepID=A0ABU0P076_STRRH|nr:hypothetical protein [Streptomyces rishiriensis]MDQ0584808.1 hypothetical protein [Streptomyces rishiriensis]